MVKLRFGVFYSARVADLLFGKGKMLIRNADLPVRYPPAKSAKQRVTC